MSPWVSTGCTRLSQNVLIEDNRLYSMDPRISSRAKVREVLSKARAIHVLWQGFFKCWGRG